ncbi:MAG: hypothetical protein KAR20_06265, partial [Candidatus Heimdallarchaeota archaeon]|nr:hypothetical protein [Candidatus Heimdallarchaeota archaeon]
AEDRIFGVIDCLRDKPLPAEKENILKRFLRQISLQFYSAFSNSHFIKVRRIREELFDMTEKMLPQFRTEDVLSRVSAAHTESICLQRLRPISGQSRKDIIALDYA